MLRIDGEGDGDGDGDGDDGDSRHTEDVIAAAQWRSIARTIAYVGGWP